ncbi:putative LRR receptor-like serine/threonine-protein kinase [Hordeum vulgare]|nr:putative LRR receptor-like serine/threonine-protein kinase [Hordeum vulgare]
MLAEDTLLNEHAKKWLAEKKKETNERGEYEAMRAAVTSAKHVARMHAEHATRMQMEEDAKMAKEQAEWMTNWSTTITYLYSVMIMTRWLHIQNQNLVGIIADFGLSRAFNDAHTHISNVAAGTLGYLDPEYHATFQLTIKTDVYSFGIVLLEIITGKPPILMDPHTYHIPNWVRQKIAKGSIQDIVNKRLLDQYDPSSLKGVVDLAMKCVESAAIDRPSMTEVVSRLKVLLPTTLGEKQCASASSTKSMNDEMRRQFHLLISEEGNDESYSSSRMTELTPLSGR